jgi:hypothetical protein
MQPTWSGPDLPSPLSHPRVASYKQQQRDVAFLSIFSSTLNSLWLVAAENVDHCLRMVHVTSAWFIKLLVLDLPLVQDMRGQEL